ncbi:MAG: type II secretion system F family protein [Chloroflexi bacterium]|nr:type II secretion system F family protein [Chloroflexota bacterium]
MCRLQLAPIALSASRSRSWFRFVPLAHPLSLVLLALVAAWQSLVPTTALSQGQASLGQTDQGQTDQGQTSQGQAEIQVVSVNTERFPKVVLRFSITPEVGAPPSYLELPDVAVAEQRRPVELLEVYTVGRLPTSRTGTYEVVWMTPTSVAPGDTVAGHLGISINSRPEIEALFRFVRPFPVQAPTERAAERQVMLPVVMPPVADIDYPFVGAVAAILAGLAALSAMAAMAYRTHLRHANERLAIWVGGSLTHRAQALARERKVKRRGMDWAPLVNQLGKIGAKVMPQTQIEKVRRQLMLAGRPSNQALTRFLAAKTGLGLGLFSLGFWLMVGVAPFLTTLSVAGCLGLVGFIIPSTSLGRAIKKRRYELRKALPDALDLMTIGVSAGLAFDGAIGEIVEKWDNALSHEFATLLGELRMGTSRREGLLHLADRTQVDEIQTMVSQLIQADELGMSLTETLLTLANQMRLRRRQMAEEQAQKAGIKMLIPLVFLIFPALFIVILGPAAQDLYQFVTQGPK